MENASRRDSGLQMFLCGGLQMSLRKTITSNRVGSFKKRATSPKKKEEDRSQSKLENISFAENKLSPRAPFETALKNCSAFPVSILLKTKYFKAAYGTFTWNWIRKKEKHSTPNLAGLWRVLTATVSLTAKLSSDLGVTWRWCWWNVVISSLLEVRKSSHMPKRLGLRMSSSTVWHQMGHPLGCWKLNLLFHLTGPNRSDVAFSYHSPKSCQQLPHPVTLPQIGTTLKDTRVIFL